MQYPNLPTNLKQAQYSELSRAHQDLRIYKNVTILNIRHWRAIPQLVASAKQVSKDQRRVMREIKARPEHATFVRAMMLSPISGVVSIARKSAQQETQKQLNKHDRVHSKFHDADGEIINVEWSSRVGTIYHVRLDSGNVVYCAREDLTVIDEVQHGTGH